MPDYKCTLWPDEIMCDVIPDSWAGGTELPSLITTALLAITDDTERFKAEIQALTAVNVRRDSPIIAMAQASLGLTDDQVDALFVD